MPIRRMTEAEAEAMRKSAAQRRAALSTSKNSSKTTSRKTNFVSPTSLVKNSASNKTSTKTSSKTSSKSASKVNSSPVRSKSSGTTSYFQPKTSAKSKTTSGRKTTSYTPWYRQDMLDMSNRKSSKDRLGGSSAYAEDYLARRLSGMSEKDWFLTNAEQALDFRSLLSNKLLTGENKLTPSQRLAMKSPLNWAQTNANLKRSTGMDLAEFNTKYLGSKLTAEEFAKRQKEDRDYWADQAAKAAEYELSPYDKKLPRTDRQRIQKEKMRWDVANSLGDFETRKTAHKMAETIRARYGYSGGAAGDQKIAADITWQDAVALNAMNAEGQGKYRMAKLELEQAVKEGNEDRIGAAEEKLSQILANPNYSSSAKPGTQNVTGHDVPRADTSDNWMDQAAETLKAVGYGVPGSLAFLAETQGQAIDDRLVEENYDYIRSKAAELPTLQARLSLVQRGEGSESWGTEEQLQKQIAIAQNMQDMLDSYGQMDQNSLGSRMMAKSQEHAAAALEGTSGLDRLLTQTAISMGQNLPGIAANFIPVVGPAIGLGLMGAQAAGSRSYELTQQGVSPSEALSRGLVSGGIEALTEKIPLDSLTKIIKGTTGASFVKNLLKQMGIEATEESASYTANYLADKIAKDPNAEWSTQELLENAAAGALSGGFFAAGGQAIGSALNRQAVTEAAATAPQKTQTDMEAQAREQALEMLAETAPGREIVPKTEPTTQQAAEAPVQTLREAAATTPASAGNAQQEQASKAQALSAAAKASPAAKTIKLRRVSGQTQTQTASTRHTASPKAQGALQQAQTALLTQMSKTLGTSGEKAMLAAWDNSGDPGQYTAGFVRVYNQALSGTTAGKIQAPASLNDAQVMAAYSAGQNDRKLSLEQAREAAQQAEVAKKNASLYASEEGTEAGLVYDSYVQESMDPDTAASLSSVAKQLGLRVQMVDSVAGGMANADIQGSAVQIEKNNPNPVRALFGHELTHRVQQLAPESYQAFRDYVMQSGQAQADVQKKITEYKRAGVKLTTEEAMDEIAADYAGEMIEDQDLLKQFIQKNKENKNVLRRFLEAVKQLASKLTGKYQKQSKDAVALLEKAVGDASRQASKLQASKNTAGNGKTKFSVKETDSGELRKLEAVDFSNGQLRKLEAEKLDDVGVSYDAETESASPARFSLKTWNASGYVTKRDEAAKVLADALKISQKKAKQYIDNVNSIAKMIADDRMRLDYEASPGRSSFVSNAEYGGSIDFSTICKKRRLFTGTFEAIQDALPNTALTAEEFLDIRRMMAEKGYEVSCGLCYVEGSRANMGQYTKQFIERFAATNPEYVPNMAEMNTASGQEKLRKEHPEVYEAYEYFMNHYGRLNPGDKALFASQQKPKMYQMATEYQGEILKKFGKKNSSVENKNANGGLRLQSFSDFEIIHLIDSMQVIMDMSRVGLAGQAYTKVPDFAWALGDTGLKINLSLIAKGVDGNGRLILDEVEGMAEADAMALRERYSDNVGTVIVVFTDRQLLAAMADERIDFIIPFHRSQWKTDQYEAMGLPANAKDFTPWQNEAYIEPVYNDSGKKQRPSNYMPNNYWNFRKSGKKNAEAYLKMCAENNRRPKFHYLLDKNNDGSYSLKKDGSTDGYWKLLIDFKMYNNEGKGSPQRPVSPEFNMEQAERMLNEYSGGHSKFPAAQDVVDEFVSKYKLEHPDTAKFSLKGSDDYNLRKLQAENEMLRERVDYWKGQTKRTEQVTTDKKAVARAARELIRQYGADMDAADIQGDLQILYDGMASGELSYSAAREQAEGIAEKLISNAVEKDDELYQQYSDLRQFLKDTKLTVSEADSRGITDYADFRRRNLSHFKLSKGQRTNVDLVYKEMSERWPEFFDEDREGAVSDQLYQIEAVLDKVYKITKYNPFDMYTSQAVSGAANEILEKFFDLPQTKKTFADRQAARLDREKAAGKRRLQEERERKNAKLEELRQKNRERVDKAIQKERERRAKDLERLKDQYQARDAAGRERRKERELRAKILRHANALSKKLLRPSDKQHIPESLRSAVANVLNSINLASKYDKPGSITKRTQAFQELRLSYENILSEADQQIVVDPDLLANISELEALKDTPIGSLNLSQLTTMWNTLKAVETSIYTANKMFGASKFETILEVAEGLKTDNEGKRDRGDYRGPIGAMDKLINAGMLTPESYFHRLGKTGEELFRMLRRAQDKHITIMQEAQEYTAGVIGKTDVRKLEKEVHHFELDGKSVDMTTAQIMSLYELTKRRQAQDHIMVGGIRVDAINKGIKRTSMSDAVRVTPEQVSEIVSTLTEGQIAIADGLQKFMGGRLAQLGNEASMEVYGYEKFKEKNYFPIKVDTNQTITDQAKDAATATISGRGFTKGTKPHANNAVMIRDIFDVYADHVTDMATYSAWLGAMENLQRVFNFKYRNADGNVTGTVKGIIHRIFGSNGQAYWKKLTEDLNNGVHGANDNPFQKLIGNYKASAIGANIRVFIQQPTSILRALDTISPGDFAAGLFKANPGTWSKVKKYAPIAVWKDWGYFDADTGRQMKSVLFGDDKKLAKVNNALMAPAGAMDSLAWSHIWNALEVETGRKHKELAKGSDAFYRKVAERFNEVIDHSQVVDGILQRSQLMRSADGATKMATSFMAEPTKIFNMFTTAAYDLRKSQDHTVRRQARKTMAKTTVALLISFVANAAAQSLVDALRDEDKDEGYWEKFFQAFTGLEGDEESKTDSIKSVAFGNMGSALNPFAYLPFVKDVVSILEGFDVKRMDMESISKFLKAAGECIKSFYGDGKMTKTNAWIGLVGEASRLLGVPAANLKRDVVAVINTWLNGTHNYKLQYEVAKFMYRIENKNNKNMFLDIAYMAWRDGDEDTFLKISQDLMDAFGEDVNGETIESAMRKRMEDQMETDADFQADQTLSDLVGVLPAFEEEEEEEETEFSAKNLNAKQYEQYSTKRAAAYREYENAVTSNPAWATLSDEAKDKVISAMWKYAGQTALEEASGGSFTITDSGVLKARAAAESGVDVGTFFIMKGVADAQEGVKTVDGVTISDSASYNKLKALRDSGLMDRLSEDQKAAVYDALGVSAKVGSMNENALDKLGASIEEEKNAPSVYSVLGEDKTEFVQEFYETCSGLSTSYDGNGKAIKGQSRQDKIIAEINKYSNLTRTEKSALYHMFYESDKNNPWA